jgi:hypothetical protein
VLSLIFLLQGSQRKQQSNQLIILLEFIGKVFCLLHASSALLLHHGALEASFNHLLVEVFFLVARYSRILYEQRVLRISPQQQLLLKSFFNQKDAL